MISTGARFMKCTGKKKTSDRIATYCQKDVVTVAQIFLRMNGEPLIKPENVEIKN